jgi:hypothetical protein
VGDAGAWLMSKSENERVDVCLSFLLYPKYLTCIYCPFTLPYLHTCTYILYTALVSENGLHLRCIASHCIWINSYILHKIIDKRLGFLSRLLVLGGVAGGVARCSWRESGCKYKYQLKYTSIRVYIYPLYCAGVEVLHINTIIERSFDNLHTYMHTYNLLGFTYCPN